MQLQQIEAGVEMEVDPKYLQRAIDSYGLGDCKEVSSPCIREESLDVADRKQLLVRRLLGEEKKEMLETKSLNAFE